MHGVHAALLASKLAPTTTDCSFSVGASLLVTAIQLTLPQRLKDRCRQQAASHKLLKTVGLCLLQAKVQQDTVGASLLAIWRVAAAKTGCRLYRRTQSSLLVVGDGQLVESGRTAFGGIAGVVLGVHASLEVQQLGAPP
jgi:urease accessory protein UreF